VDGGWGLVAGSRLARSPLSIRYCHLSWGDALDDANERVVVITREDSGGPRLGIICERGRGREQIRGEYRCGSASRFAPLG
jgi:hypothetical protein